MGNVIPPLATRPRTSDAELKERSVVSLSADARAVPHPGCRTMTYLQAGRRTAVPVRLSVARQLGGDIDGAWWPRADRITNELPALVAALRPLVGDISSVNVNWPPLQRPPDFNWHGWEHKRQHVMTFDGSAACVHLLIVPYATYSALALMVLRRAAGLPVDPADRDKPAFLTAGAILQSARQQCAARQPLR